MRVGVGGVQREETYVYLWQIHVAVWQKYNTVIKQLSQLEVIIKRKESTETIRPSPIWSAGRFSALQGNLNP